MQCNGVCKLQDNLTFSTSAPQMTLGKPLQNKLALSKAATNAAPSRYQQSSIYCTEEDSTGQDSSRAIIQLTEARTTCRPPQAIDRNAIVNCKIAEALSTPLAIQRDDLLANKMGDADDDGKADAKAQLLPISIPASTDQTFMSAVKRMSPPVSETEAITEWVPHSLDAYQEDVAEAFEKIPLSVPSHAPAKSSALASPRKLAGHLWKIAPSLKLKKVRKPGKATSERARLHSHD